MNKVVVTGVTGKSGLFFYKELCNHAENLSDYDFYFIVRDRAKAEKLLNCEKLNQHLLVGSLTDQHFVNTISGLGEAVRKLN